MKFNFIPPHPFVNFSSRAWHVGCQPDQALSEFTRGVRGDEKFGISHRYRTHYKCVYISAADDGEKSQIKNKRKFEKILASNFGNFFWTGAFFNCWRQMHTQGKHFLKTFLVELHLGGTGGVRLFTIVCVFMCAGARNLTSPLDGCLFLLVFIGSERFIAPLRHLILYKVIF